jgi:hypothetical protein
MACLIKSVESRAATLLPNPIDSKKEDHTNNFQGILTEHTNNCCCSLK